MRLINLLKQPGGIHEQGREVRFPLRYLDGKTPATREITAVLLPLSDKDWVAVEQQTVASLEVPDADGAQPRSRLPRDVEFSVQFLRMALRDPGDLGARLIDEERDVEALRDGLIGVQHQWFAEEYRQLLATEYPSLIKQKDVADLHQEAAGFSQGGQK